jgi:hypothetical protein
MRLIDLMTTYSIRHLFNQNKFGGEHEYTIKEFVGIERVVGAQFSFRRLPTGCPSRTRDNH